MTGASIGTMLGGPGIGTAIGAGVGGLGGWLMGGKDDPKYGYDPNQANFQLPGYEGMSGQYAGALGQGPRSAPQAGLSGFQGDQRQLADMLMSQAQGQGPGQEIARMQAETQVDRGLGQQLAGARSARPGQSAMAARNAAMAAGNLQGAGAQAATMGGLQAQQGAIGSLGSVLGQARGQDLQRAMGNAQLRYQTMGLDDNRQMELLRQQLMMNQAQQQGNIGYEGALAGKAGQQFAYDASQPSDFQRIMGAGQGLGQAYLAQKAGSAPAGGQPPPSYFGQSDPNRGYGGGSY
jgi:hypothetical protein